MAQFISRFMSPKKAFSKKRSFMIVTAMRTTTRSVRLLKACALPMRKARWYWLAKMFHAGEDFRFIARRIVIFASEDIGLADPEALQLAIATQQAVEFVGMPEARVPSGTCHGLHVPRRGKSRESL